MIENNLVFGFIPYKKRKENESCHSSQEIEKFLLDAFAESFVSKVEIASVYVDNKYEPQSIIVEVYKGVEPLAEIVTVNWGEYVDEVDEPLNVWVHYRKTDILPAINIVKQTCIELNISQGDLAYILGVKEQSLRNMISKNSFSTQIKRSINLLIENHQLHEKLKECSDFKKIIKKFIE